MILEIITFMNTKGIDPSKQQTPIPARRKDKESAIVSCCKSLSLDAN
jgi:hypothetical protein